MTQEQIDIERFGRRCRLFLEGFPEAGSAQLWGVSIDQIPEADLRVAVMVIGELLNQERNTATFFATKGRAA